MFALTTKVRCNIRYILMVILSKITNMQIYNSNNIHLGLVIDRIKCTTIKNIFKYYIKVYYNSNNTHLGLVIDTIKCTTIKKHF